MGEENENENMEMGKQGCASVADKVAGIVAGWKGRAVLMEKGRRAGKGGGCRG